MADDPDDLVIRILREIQGTLQEHSRMHNQHAEEFGRLNAKMEEWQETTATAAGFAFHSNVRHEAVQRKLDELEERLNRLEQSH